MKGHVRRRSANSWELKFDVGADPLTGKRRIRYHNVKGNKREALIKLAQLVAENAAGNAVEPSKLTVSEFIERWLRDWAKDNVSAKTFERYAELLRHHVAVGIGSIRLQKLRAIDIQQLYSGLIKKPLSARTVGHVHRVLHRALGHANRWGLLQQNIAALVSPPRVTATEIELLTPEQVKIMLERLRGRTIYPIVVTALATGMRRGELLALRWQDVNLEKASLRVERSLEETKAGLRFKAPKTKHGRRSITLPPSAVSALRDHWKAQQETRLKLRMGKAPAEALVFATWDGKPRSPNALTKEWRREVKAAEMPLVTLHSLRHTHASHLISQGLDVLAISRRLGHGSPAITLGVYGHLFPGIDDRAASAIESVFGAK
jgi:integrase